MSGRVLAPDDLLVSWTSEGFVAWTAMSTSSRDVSHLVGRVLGKSLVSSASDRPESHDLTSEAAETLGRDQISAVRLPTTELAELCRTRRPSAAQSASVAWLIDASRLAAALMESGRVLPGFRSLGLRWRSTWRRVADPIGDAQLTRLTDTMPPVIGAVDSSARSRDVLVEAIVSTLLDALCRNRLDEADWRPPLPRSRAADVVTFRRAAATLSGPDAVFVADSIAQERFVTTMADRLAELHSRLEGGPAAHLSAELVAPEPGGDRWRLELMATDDRGQRRDFSELWAIESDDDFGGGADLRPLRGRIRLLLERLGDRRSVFASIPPDRPPGVVELHPSDVAELLDQADPVDPSALTIVVPDGMQIAAPRVTARAAPAAPDAVLDRPRTRVSDAMLDVDWGLALGDLDLTAAEIEILAAGSAELVNLRGNWVRVDHAQLRKTLDRLERHRLEDHTLTPAGLLRARIADLEDAEQDLSADGWFAELLRGLPDERLTEAEEPPGFTGELRPYQRRALSWLQFLGRLGLGGVLADDMGLGKTPTALAHLHARSLGRLHDDLDHRPHLVICPLSVVSNWQAEAERFTPQLSPLIVHGPERPKGQALIDAAMSHDLVITTYGTAARIVDELEPIEFDVVVCDEAQMIKNHTTNAARAVRLLRSEQRIGLTGTPVENRLTELWAILDACNPGMLGGISWFRRTFASPIDSGDVEPLDRLRRLTGPFVLRRTKADRSLVPDLPDKIESTAWATLTAEQAGLYQAVVTDFNERAATATGMERRGLVLATLTRLKQVCNHPAHLLGEGDDGELAGRSGKLERFDELVDTLLEAEERAIVFTQYREMGDLLVRHLGERLGLDVPFLHGGTTRRGRTEMVERFQDGSGPPLQLVSLRAGGTGLNLTAASRVIHYDRWWNPAVEDQATDRTWRIGQTQTVFVHRMVCAGTLEERIDRMLDEKRALASVVVGSDDAWLTELSTDELRELVRLDEARTGVLDSSDRTEAPT